MTILIKQPSESKLYAMDFSNLLADGDSLAAITSVGDTPTGELTLSGEVIAGETVTFTVAGGVDGTTYWLEVIATTTLGETLEGDGYLYVTDTPEAALLAMTASYPNLLERIGNFAFGIRSGFSDDQVVDIEETIQDGLQQVYAAHNWSFFRPIKTITTVAGTSTYSLPTGYESIETELHYAPGESDFYPPVVMRHDNAIRKLQQDNEDTEYDRPRYFCVRSVEFDAKVGSRRQIVLWPTPDDTYVLYARMTLRPVMIDDTYQYPIGGETLSRLMVESCLAAAERNFDDTEDIHTKQYAELLPLAIAADLAASSPVSLGPDAPQGESTDLQALSMRMGDITFNGVTL